jgi:hypothetical protein
LGCDFPRDFKSLGEEHDSLSVSDQLGEHVYSVASFSEPEGASITGSQEMMISRYSRFANKQSTAANQSFIAVHPDVKILTRLVP